MCNEINLEELEALANAAGGVKWIACGPSYGEAKPAFLDEVNVDDDEYPEAVCQYPAGCRSDVSDKMAYIAEANPATLLSLLDRLKSAEAERDAMAARLAELEGQDAVLERNGLKPIPTAVTIAPRGYSFHGVHLQKDELGTLTRKPQAKGD